MRLCDGRVRRMEELAGLAGDRGPLEDHVVVVWWWGQIPGSPHTVSLSCLETLGRNRALCRWPS